MKSDSHITLIDRLNDIVDDIHIDEVKSIVTTLSEINTFKHSIESNLCEETLYKNVSQKLYEQFHIENFKIEVINNSIATLIYKNGELNCKYNDSYSKKISDEISIIFDYCTSELIDEKQIILNTYIKELIHIIYIQYVLTSLKKSEAIDPLTKLTNRVSFQQELKTIIPLAIRESMNLGLMIINIDRFRAVNDEHGDLFGDRFLQLYADTIKNCVRTSDIVVRFGGGEFLVLLINVDTEQRTIDIAHKIKDKLAQTYLESPNGDKFKKTVCVGISMYPQDSTDINHIIKNAEISLSDARDSGRNQVHRFQQMDESPIELF